MLKKILIKLLSIMCFLTPIAVFIIGCMIKDISFTNSGVMLFGIVVGFMGGLYVLFGASDKQKLPLGCMVLGSVISMLSFVSVVIGVCMVVAPIAFLGGNKLWKISS